MIENGKVVLDELDMLYHIQERMDSLGYELEIEAIQKVIDFEIEYLVDNGLIEYDED